MRLPTVRLKHKQKGKIITVNESDWAQDLGRYKWSAFERVGERHNDAGQALEVTTTLKPAPTQDGATPKEPGTPRRRGRPRTT